MMEERDLTEAVETAVGEIEYSLGRLLEDSEILELSHAMLRSWEHTREVIARNRAEPIHVPDVPTHRPSWTWVAAVTGAVADQNRWESVQWGRAYHAPMSRLRARLAGSVEAQLAARNLERDDSGWLQEIFVPEGTSSVRVRQAGRMVVRTGWPVRPRAMWEPSRPDTARRKDAREAFLAL